MNILKTKILFCFLKERMKIERGENSLLFHSSLFDIMILSIFSLTFVAKTKYIGQ